MSAYAVETRNIAGEVTAVGSAGAFTVVVDRPMEAGGGGLGFNRGQLLYMSVAACVSNDLFRETAKKSIRLETVRVRVDGDFTGDPAVSAPITYHVDVEDDAPREALDELVAYVDRIAEIPNSIRNGTPVRIASMTTRSTR